MRKSSYVVACALVAAVAGGFPFQPAYAGGGEHQGCGMGGMTGGNAAQPAGTSESMKGHSHEKACLHGGEVAMTKQHHFETVFSPDGIRIYLYSMRQSPLMVGEAGGTVTLMFKDGTKKGIPLVREAPAPGESAVYFCPMHEDVVRMEPGVCPKCGGMKLYTQDRLSAKADLAGARPGSVEAVVHITRLEGSERDVTFAQALQKLIVPIVEKKSSY